MHTSFSCRVPNAFAKPPFKWFIPALLGLVLIFPYQSGSIAKLPVASSVAQQAPTSGSSTACPSQGTNQCASLTLDDVRLQILTPFLPATFSVASSGAATQVADAAAYRPFSEFMLMAIPYGTIPGAETLPVSAAGAASEYLQALHDYRAGHGGIFAAAPAVSIFGTKASGQTSLSHAVTEGDTLTLISEWVADAGSRLWLLRISEERPAGEASFTPTSGFTTSLGQIGISAENLETHTTVGRFSQARASSGIRLTAWTDTPTVPTPSWWSGSNGCDSDHVAGAGVITTAADGLIACGPPPGLGCSYTTHFFSGAIGVCEFSCIELSKRYLYQVYSIVPYTSNGSQVVWNFAGNRLVRILNNGSTGPVTTTAYPNWPSDNTTKQVSAFGSVGLSPLPGDIVSFGATNSYGHTAVVISAAVDGNGNGSVTMLEENGNPNATRIDSISHWVLQDALVPTGWLHDAAGSRQLRSASWALRSSNDTGPANVPPGSAPFSYGARGWIPVVGDWCGTGIEGNGVYVPGSPSTWYLHCGPGPGTATYQISYGGPSDYPVVGDWTGLGFDSIGFARYVVSQGIEWHLRNLTTPGGTDGQGGTALADTLVQYYGGLGSYPVVGDWTGQLSASGHPIDTIGVAIRDDTFAPAYLTWRLRNSNTPGPNDVAVFSYGLNTDLAVVGDWTGQCFTTIGVARGGSVNGTLVWYLRNLNSGGNPDITVNGYGNPSDAPVPGKWTGIRTGGPDTCPASYIGAGQ